MKIIFITLLMGLLSLFKAGATEDISVLSNEDKKESNYREQRKKTVPSH